MRLVADQIRGRSVSDAVGLLSFSQLRAAGMMAKLLNSAIANAEHNQGADVDELRIIGLQVGEGPTMKRMRPRARGRGSRILKRSCHVTLKLGDGSGPEDD